MSLRWIYNRLIPTLLAMAALVGLWCLGQQGESMIFDRFMQWSALPAGPNSPVVLLLIDDASLDRLKNTFGPAPWPRRAFIDIFNRINAARPALMVLDGHFVNINERDDTSVFNAMRGFRNLITGLVMEESAIGRNDLNTALPQYYRLNLGVVSVKEEPDGVIRSLKPVFQVHTSHSQAGIFPALSLAAASEYLNATQPGGTWVMDVDRAARPPALHLYPESKPRQGIAVPMSAGGDAFYLRWYQLVDVAAGEFARSHPAIPLSRFYEPGTPLPDLRGKIALIGSSASFYRDYHQTPMSLRHLGPDVHATAIDNILNGQAVRKAGFWTNLAILMLFCTLMMLLRLRMRSFGRTLLYTLGTMVIFCWLAFWLLQHSWWVDVLTPELFMVVAFLAGSTFRIIFREQQLAVMERNLSQLVDPEVFREIRRRSHVLKPGGQKLDITSMFVDIRNFTTLAERLTPAEVTELLNEFYAEVVTVIFNHQGTIDKFMGDGILIIFGAPLVSEGHRETALAAARDILEVTGHLSTRWREVKGLQTEIGISLNSGAAFVGFLGPADKLEYTGVGDTVNICVRLQEHAKQFKTRLIISEFTVQAPERSHPNGTGRSSESDALKIDPDKEYISLGEVTVRGREATLSIYTLQEAILEA